MASRFFLRNIYLKHFRVLPLDNFKNSVEILPSKLKKLAKVTHRVAYKEIKTGDAPILNFIYFFETVVSQKQVFKCLFFFHWRNFAYRMALRTYIFY